jgi:Uma2 family endonuclease
MAHPQVPTTTHEWPAPGDWTYDDWLALPDDGSRYEVIDGELFVTPPPSIAHQSVSIRLSVALSNFVDERSLGRVLEAPTGVRLPGQSVPLEPDILFVSAERSRIVGTHYIEGAPDLLVEILSPGSRTYDRRTKRRVYEAAGVPEYWLLDYEAKTIEVLVLEGGAYAVAGTWGPGEAVHARVIDGFVVSVDDVFRDV